MPVAAPPAPPFPPVPVVAPPVPPGPEFPPAAWPPEPLVAPPVPETPPLPLAVPPVATVPPLALVTPPVATVPPLALVAPPVAAVPPLPRPVPPLPAVPPLPTPPPLPTVPPAPAAPPLPFPPLPPVPPCAGFDELPHAAAAANDSRTKQRPMSEKKGLATRGVFAMAMGPSIRPGTPMGDDHVRFARRTVLSKCAIARPWPRSPSTFENAPPFPRCEIFYDDENKQNLACPIGRALHLCLRQRPASAINGKPGWFDSAWRQRAAKGSPGTRCRVRHGQRRRQGSANA